MQHLEGEGQVMRPYVTWESMTRFPPEVPDSRRSAPAVNDSFSSIRGCGSAVLCAAALVLAAGKAVAWAADFCVAKTQKCRKIETKKKPFARQKPAEWLSIWDPQHIESRIESLMGSCISSFFCLTEKHILDIRPKEYLINNTVVFKTAGDIASPGLNSSTWLRSLSFDTPGSTICVQSGPNAAGHSSHLDWCLKAVDFKKTGWSVTSQFSCSLLAQDASLSVALDPLLHLLWHCPI